MIQLAAEVKGNRDAVAERIASLIEIIDEQGAKIEALEKRVDQAAKAFAELKRKA